MILLWIGLSGVAVVGACLLLLGLCMAAAAGDRHHEDGAS